MLTRFASIPIFRRLFLAFLLAVIIPDTIILILSIIYTNALLAHGVKMGQISPFIIETILALILSTGVVIVLGYLLNITITQPLNELATLARRIRQGDTNARASLTGRDEIAVVAQSINDMLEQIVRLLKETQGQRDDLQGQVEHLVHDVSGVGQGDLSVQAEVTHASLGVLADSFNYMVEALSTLVIRVKTAVVEVEISTTATQQEMRHLVTTAETLLQQIGKTVNIVEAMAQSCLQVVGRTQILDQGAKEAKQAVQEGRQSMQLTLKGIKVIQDTAQQATSQIQRLGERSQEINEIIHVLETIAQQTNKLALDAAIQVAMAGDATNTGFGAIAEDIRRLSERTKEHLIVGSRTVSNVQRDIITVAESIQQSEKETVANAMRIQETGQSFSTLFRVFEEQTEEISNIHHMAKNQLKSSQEISLIMKRISEYTAQSTTSTFNVAKKMWQLFTLAQKLRRSVEVFRVKDDSIVQEMK